jgi:IPT/TIG domain
MSAQPAPRRRKIGRRTGVGTGAVPAPVIILLAILLVLIMASLLYSLWQLWPPAPPGIQPQAETVQPMSSDFLWWELTLSREQNFLVIVALAGALGATVHGLRSLSTYVGERLMYQSWILLYLLLPWVGAALATIVYLVLRAGLIGAGGVNQTDPFGFAAVAGLVGLFSAQASEKLKKVFEELFAKVPPGSESVEELDRPTIISFRPAEGTTGTEVSITGANFDDETTVTFGAAAAPVLPPVSDTQIRATVPSGLAPGRFKIRVENAIGEATSEAEFEVTSP